MNNNQASNLISKLISGTKSGKVKWTAGSGGTMEMFTTSVGDNLISLYGTVTTVLRIHSKNGDVIDSYMPLMAAGGPSLSELFELAKQNALGSDKVIDEILRELSK